MVKRIKAPKKPKSVRTKKLKKVTSKPSNTQFSNMNDDCLMYIFDQLDTNSLVKLSKMNQRLKGIVVDRVIPLKTVQFDEIRRNSSIRKVFEKFGPSMTRLSISAHDIQMTQPGLSRFAEFLRLLTVYGTPGKLRQLTISDFGDEFLSIPAELFEAVQPYLENIHTLIVNRVGTGTNNFLNDFMNNIPKHNLCHLHLSHIPLIGEWLSVESLPSLQSIHIRIIGHVQSYEYRDPFGDQNIDRLKKYIVEKPQLTKFNYKGQDEEAIFMEVSRHIPNIGRIGTIKSWWPERLFRKYNLPAKWKYLKDFTGLKHFSLETTDRDLSCSGGIFRVLAGRNTIEHLDLIHDCAVQYGNDTVDFDDLRKMTNIKSLRLFDFVDQTDEFMCQLFESLTGLYECTIENYFRSRFNQEPIITLVRTGRNLRFLNMESLSATFYRKLVKIRKDAHPDLVNQPLVIRVPKKIADKCESKLTSSTYEPTIITIQPIQSQVSFFQSN